MNIENKLLVCDFDGVLIDSELIGCRIWSDMLGGVGAPVSVEAMLNDYTGKSGPQICVQIEKDFGYKLPDGFLDTVNERVETLFETQLKAMPRALETLAGLNMAKCIASGSRPERLFQCLRVTKLDALFNRSNVFSSHEVKRGKPAPDVFLYAAEKTGFRPSDCIVLEDSVAGVQAGLAAGMTVLGFTGGSHCTPFRIESLKKAGACLLFDDFAALPDVLSRLPDVTGSPSSAMRK